MKLPVRAASVALFVLTLTVACPMLATEAEDASKKKTPEAAPAKQPAAPAATPEKPAEAAPAAVAVKRETVEIKVTLDGSFEADKTAEVVLRPKQWTTFKVLEAVEHGTRVKRGAVLVQFDTEAIDNGIDDQRTSLELADLSLKQAEEDLRLLEASTPMDLALAARSKRLADEDFARYKEVDLPMSKKSAERNLETAKNYLEYEQEELRQLEKMYKADDLTEETEEIVLKRQRDAVKRAEFSLERAKVSYDRSLNLSLPREMETFKQMVERQDLSKARSDATLPILLRRQQLELDKMKVQRKRDQDKLDKLLADRDTMTIKAPFDGVVYYGKWSLGKWSGVTSGGDELRRGASVSANKIIMTVVQPRPLVLRATVPEKEIHWIQPDLEATVKPTGYPDVKLRATVSEVSQVPVSSGNFSAKFALRMGKNNKGLMPGMSAKAELVPYKHEDALTVPATALSTDQLDESRIYVHLAAKDGKSKKRRVQVGRKSGDRVEILGGLKEGDKVLKEYPKEEK
jgi:multidrug efflux pump subunit AcrA (membrane-fusion protein)